MVISLYYYFGVIRAIYWSRDAVETSPIPISCPIRVSLYGCIAGIFYLGLFPGAMVNYTIDAAKALGF